MRQRQKKNELIILADNTFIHYATNQTTWELAYEDFKAACGSVGIKLNATAPIRVLLRSNVTGEVISVMPEVRRRPASPARRMGTGFHSTSLCG